MGVEVLYGSIAGQAAAAAGSLPCVYLYLGVTIVVCQAGCGSVVAVVAGGLEGYVPIGVPFVFEHLDGSLAVQVGYRVFLWHHASDAGSH